MRAREPDRSGFAVRSGVRLYYEVHGDGPATMLFLPPWAIVHSRSWKLQVPTWRDMPGSWSTTHAATVGRTDRPGPAAYDDDGLVADAVAVLDALGVADAVVVGLSLGARVLLGLAADHPNGCGARLRRPGGAGPRRGDPIVAAFESANGTSRTAGGGGTPATGARPAGVRGVLLR